MTKRRLTRTAAIAVVPLTLLLGGCVTPVASSTLTCTPEVRAKYQDGVLAGTLFEDRDVVSVADIKFFPHARIRKVIALNSVVPYKKDQTCVEAWTVQHDDGTACTYTVKYIPDGHGGTSFTVRKESNISVDVVQ